MAQRLSIVMVAAEAVPFAKVGGLADVLGALPAALARRGHRVKLILPGYRQIDRARFGFRPAGSMRVSFGTDIITVGVARSRGADAVETLLLESPHFDRDGLYEDPKTGIPHDDSGERFAFFCRAVSEWLAATPREWDIIHVHDYHAALVPAYLRTTLRSIFPPDGPRTLFTIHNLAYQGNFDPALYFRTWLPWDLWYPMSPFEFWGRFSFMKAGIQFADHLSTVSPRYAEEILTPAFGSGMEGVLRDRKDRLTGILNGIDTSIWNPADDPHLKARYGPDTLARKADNKRQLQADSGLNQNLSGPLLGMVSRLVDQKGFDIVAAALPHLMAKGFSLVLLGTGQPHYHNLVRDAEKRYAGHMKAFLTFDDVLAHRIEAGADFFLMPSRFEPCGLNQMMSLRYGTPPIVRRTGGLADSVQEFSPSARTGNGFVFDDPSSAAFVAACDRALYVYRDPGLLTVLQQNGMGGDYSWARSAQKYEELYWQMKRAH